jgi:hypothetical protein
MRASRHVAHCCSRSRASPLGDPSCRAWETHSTAFRQPLQAATTARVVQSRTVRLINGVALDECHRSGALPDARTIFKDATGIVLKRASSGLLSISLWWIFGTIGAKRDRM